MGKYNFKKVFFQNAVGPNDKRRSKSRCTHFCPTKGKDGFCSIKGHRCTGSAFCDDYKESKNLAKKPKYEINKTSTDNKETTATFHTIPTTNEILIGEKILSPSKKIGEIVDVREKILYVRMLDEIPKKIHKVGFAAFNNPTIGRWTAVDADIQKYILYMLKK